VECVTCWGCVLVCSSQRVSCILAVSTDCAFDAYLEDVFGNAALLWSQHPVTSRSSHAVAAMPAHSCMVA